MKTKILTTDEDLKFYADITSSILNINYPLSYFKEGYVRAFYNDHNEICGGYFFGFNNFRSTMGLPDHAKAAFDSKYNNEDIAEMNALWLAKDVKGHRDNFSFWVRIYLDIIKSKRKYIIYTYDEDSKKLRNLYSILNPKVIYRGETKCLEGMTYTGRESIEIASVKYIKYGILHSGDFLIKKLFLSRKRATALSHSLFPTIKQKLLRSS
jgi:hypothetical protein